jgi:hypothetical protein
LWCREQNRRGWQRRIVSELCESAPLSRRQKAHDLARPGARPRGQVTGASATNAASGAAGSWRSRSADGRPSRTHRPSSPRKRPTPGEPVDLRGRMNGMRAEADGPRAPWAWEGEQPALDLPAGGCWGVAGDDRSSDARIPRSSGTVQKRQPPGRASRR